MACSKPATSKTFEFEASVVKKDVKVKVYINNESTLHLFPFSLTAAETVGLPLLASDLKSLILSELHEFLPTKEGQKYVLYGRNQTGIESIIADDTPLKSIMTIYILDGSFRIKQV